MSLYLEASEFDTRNAQSTGGQTGSKKVNSKDGKTSYQLKPSILDASKRRQIKAHWTDRENFGEFIAAAVCRDLSGSNQPDAIELVPEVALVYDKERQRISVASKYLKDVEGTIDQQTEKQGSKKRHAKVSFQESNSPDVYSLAGDDKSQLRKDLAEALGVSILSGDHDVNPSNMMIVDDNGNSRIARIDFGHAFNDLLNAPRIFGGKLRNRDNQVMDYLNRRDVGHLLPSKRAPKLWRDYQGVVPSRELAEAFEKMGNKDVETGIQNAQNTFLQLVQDLAPSNQKVLNHIKKSLIAISNNISPIKIGSKELVKMDAEMVLNRTCLNLAVFYNKRQEEMLRASKLMGMQLDIDEYIKGDKSKLDSIKSTYKELSGTSDKIEWIKSDRRSKIVHASLEDFMEMREKELNPQPAFTLTQTGKNRVDSANAPQPTKNWPPKVEKDASAVRKEFNQILPEAIAQKHWEVTQALLKEHKVTQERLDEFNADLKKITDRIPRENHQSLGPDIHELVDTSPPPFPMPDKEDKNPDIPHFILSDDGKHYDISVPAFFSGHVFVPRVDSKNEDVGHDLLEYRNGKIHLDGCVVGGHEVGISSMVSPKVMEQLRERTTVERGRAVG